MVQNCHICAHFGFDTSFLSNQVIDIKVIVNYLCGSTKVLFVIKRSIVSLFIATSPAYLLYRITLLKCYSYKNEDYKLLQVRIYLAGI